MIPIPCPVMPMPYCTIDIAPTQEAYTRCNMAQFASPAPPADVPGQGSGPEIDLFALALTVIIVSIGPQEIELPSPSPLFPSSSGQEIGDGKMGDWQNSRIGNPSCPPPLPTIGDCSRCSLASPWPRPRRPLTPTTPGGGPGEILHSTVAAVGQVRMNQVDENETKLDQTLDDCQPNWVDHLRQCGNDTAPYQHTHGRRREGWGHHRPHEVTKKLPLST